jgi:hypothetical protein
MVHMHPLLESYVFIYVLTLRFLIMVQHPDTGCKFQACILCLGLLSFFIATNIRYFGFLQFQSLRKLYPLLQGNFCWCQNFHKNAAFISPLHLNNYLLFKCIHTTRIPLCCSRSLEVTTVYLAVQKRSRLSWRFWWQDLKFEMWILNSVSQCFQHF